VGLDVVVRKLRRRVELYIRLGLDRLLDAFFVFERHVALLSRIRLPSGLANSPRSSITMMPWRFLEQKDPPAPPRRRVHLLRPIPSPKELVVGAGKPANRAA